MYFIAYYYYTTTTTKFVPKQEINTGMKKKSNLRCSVQRKINQWNKCWKDYKMCPSAKNFAAYKKKRNEVNHD